MSKILSFPRSFDEILDNFSDCFTKPTFRYFKTIVSGILLSQKKSINRFFVLGDMLKHFTDYHRFLYHYKWASDYLSIKLLEFITHCFSLRTLNLALDDTLVPKYRKKIYGRGTHFDHAAKQNLAQYIKGHNWVIMGVLHHIKVLSKWICFPINAQLFIPEKATTQDRFLTKIDLAIMMLEYIRENVSIPISLVADALYAKAKLVQTCIAYKIPFVSRLRNDAALYQPHSVVQKKQGRPAKKGKRLASLEKLSQEKNKFSVLNVLLYGESKKIKVREFNAYWKPAQNVIKVIIVWYPQKKKEIPAYFFTTDLNASVENVVKIIAARWSLENAFKDMKQHLGFNAWQCRKESSVLRSIPLTCFAYSALVIWSTKQLEKETLTFWDVMPWDRHKTSISIADMIYQLKTQCIEKSIYSLFEKERISDTKIKELEQILRLAA